MNSDSIHALLNVIEYILVRTTTKEVCRKVMLYIKLLNEPPIIHAILYTIVHSSTKITKYKLKSVYRVGGGILRRITDYVAISTVVKLRSNHLSIEYIYKVRDELKELYEVEVSYSLVKGLRFLNRRQRRRLKGEVREKILGKIYCLLDEALHS